MRVLICDDEPSVRLLFRTTAERCGADVRDSLDVVGMAGDWAPDVVILDHFMPGIDGLTLLPPLRAACPSAAIYLVSAHPPADLFERGVQAGATACFEKLGFYARIPELLDCVGAVP